MAVMPFSPRIGLKYTIIGSDGTRCVLNDDSDPDYAGVLSELTGLDSAEVRENAQDLVERHGGIHGRFFFGRRPITFKALVYKHTSASNRDVLLDKLMRATAAMSVDGYLYWLPVEVNQNLVVNPSAAGNTTGAVSPTAPLTVTRVTGDLPGPATTGYELGGTLSATSGGVHFARSGTGAGGFPVSASKLYSARADVETTSLTSGALNALALTIFWWKSDGTASTTPSNTLQTQSSPALGTDYVLSGTATSPSDAAYATLRYEVTTTNPTTFTARIANILLSKSSTVPAYFDGDTAGYYWQGTPHYSPATDYIEMRVPFRRQQPLRIGGGYNKEAEVALVSHQAFLESSYESNAVTTAGGALPQSLTLATRGNAQAWPTRIRVYGPITDPEVWNTITGNSIIQLLGTIPNGEFWEINAVKRTVVSNLGDNKYSQVGFPQSTWEGLLSGSNTIQMEGTGGGAATKLYIDWRDAWV